MKLTEQEYDFICDYRCLTDTEKLAVRRALHIGDMELLRRLFRERGNQLDDFGGLAVTQGDNQGTFLAAEVFVDNVR